MGGIHCIGFLGKGGIYSLGMNLITNTPPAVYILLQVPPGNYGSW